MEVKSENLNEFIELMKKAMEIINLYEDSRPGNFAFTKLEEAILWTQVLVGQVPLLKKEDAIEGELIKK